MTEPRVSVDLNRLIGQFPNYQDPNRIRNDVMNVSRHSRTLVPVRGKLTLNTGVECQLLMLQGTVPTFFRGAQYHTPVEIYITENYPMSPPICYIRPTAGMSLKVGHRHVDSGGLVYLPYLHEWSSRTHTLVELCAHMSSVFGAEPPLFATPKAGSTTPSARPTPTPTPLRSSYQPGNAGREAANRPYQGSPYAAASGSPYGSNATMSQAAPVLPPRPDPEEVRKEKEASLTAMLQGELQGVYGQLRTEMDAALETQDRLEDNQHKVEANVEELTRRKKELERLTEVAQQRRLELDTYLEERKKEGEPSVDELIEPKDSMSQQMLQLVAENAALEDGLYYLDVGVTDGAVSVEVFLKEVRKLARRQFVARATAKKVEKAQHNLNAQRAAFEAEQARNAAGAGTGGNGGYYPHLPPQQQHNPPARGYMSGPPPVYTPTAVGGNGYPAPSVYGRPAAGAAGAWGGVAAGGVYPSYAGGFAGGAAARGVYGAQASHTQRR